jgi:uncharacterized membrane protein
MQNFALRIKHLIFFFSILSGVFLAQTITPTFEGEIVYANTYKSKNSKLKEQQLAAMLGSTHNYFIKDGDYKTVTNGVFAQWQLYVNNENRVYNKMASSDTVFWANAAEHDDEVLSMKMTPNAVTILGYKCDELILNCRSGVQKYYFSSKLRVDSKLYSKHLYGNYYAYVSKTNAIPLKSIIEDAEFIMESVAKEIKPKKMTISFFRLPAGTKTAKSAY